ncbi:MAG TPA: ATPase domain-containing protein [Methanocella sp.]|nr:ATPase domain-containing protein [Methanocella sp.]
MNRDSVSTGIEGLNELLCGGIPKGSTVLISGPPGAGKTVLSLQYAFYHASLGEKVLFVSTAEPLYKVNRYASSLSFYNLDLISGGVNMEFYEPKSKQGYIELQDYSLGQMVDEQYLGDFFDGIQKKVTRRSIDHLIVDSITSINMLLGDEIERRKKTLLFSAWVSRVGCTTLLTAESNGGEATERFLTDAVIDMSSTEIRPMWAKDTLQNMRGRTIGVTKLRGKSHLSGRYIYNITAAGIHIIGTGHQTSHQRGDTTGIPDMDSLIGGFAPGDRWHFNADVREPFDLMLVHMVKETLKAGEGVVLFAPSLGISDEATLKKVLGETALEAFRKGRIIIVLKNLAGTKARENTIHYSPERIGGYIKLAADIKSHISRKKHNWRAFLDLAGLGECDNAPSARAIFDGLLGPLSRITAITITFSDSSIGNDALTVIEQLTTGVIDIWHMDLYWLFRVRKAPATASYESHVLTIEEDQIKLMRL